MLKRDPNSSYVKYSNLGFQLIACILVGYFGGKYLDNHLIPGKPPYFTITLILLLIIGFLYKMIKDLSNNQK